MLWKLSTYTRCLLFPLGIRDHCRWLQQSSHLKHSRPCLTWRRLFLQEWVIRYPQWLDGAEADLTYFRVWPAREQQRLDL